MPSLGAFALLVGVAAAAGETAAINIMSRNWANTAENPIRKVVTMMQMMQNKIIAEGKKNKELYDKYMCFCENADSTLGKEIGEAESRIPQLEAQIKAAKALKLQLEAEVKAHQSDRTSIEATMKRELEILNKKKAHHADTQDELKANILALERAIAALEKGTYGSFLQTSAAATLRKLTISMDMSSTDRNELAAFLAGGSATHYVPQAQEIIGILKQMLDEFKADLKDDVDQAAHEVSEYKETYTLNAARWQAATTAIEEKLKRIGELSVQIAMLENELEDTIAALEENKKFLLDLERNCEAKKKEWAAYKAMQAQELTALADTIKFLNDDDALELFKKTLPSSASLLQMTDAAEKRRRSAMAVLASFRAKGAKDSRLDFLTLAIHGKKIGFEKIIGMIDRLIAVLIKEQKDDDDKKNYCKSELDKSDDQKKAVDHSIADLDTEIADISESIASLKAEIEALEDGIRALDEQVSEATAQRKDEHETFLTDQAANQAAIDLLGLATNRLNKFYNPKLYKAPPKRVLTEAERITVNNGGTLTPTAAPGGIADTGIRAAFTQMPKAPEADLTYNKKSQAGGGVLEMIRLLTADLEKDMAAAKADEMDAQADYETYIAASAEKRATDSKNMNDKEGSLAELEQQLLDDKDALKDKKIELMGVEKYIMELHKECDWLLKYYPLRKEARAGEIESLNQAKDVLRGADYSL